MCQPTLQPRSVARKHQTWGTWCTAPVYHKHIRRTVHEQTFCAVNKSVIDLLKTQKEMQLTIGISKMIYMEGVRADLLVKGLMCGKYCVNHSYPLSNLLSSAVGRLMSNIFFINSASYYLTKHSAEWSQPHWEPTSCKIAHYSLEHEEPQLKEINQTCTPGFTQFASFLSHKYFVQWFKTLVMFHWEDTTDSLFIFPLSSFLFIYRCPCLIDIPCWRQ